jgi:hypothetical protein
MVSKRRTGGFLKNFRFSTISGHGLPARWRNISKKEMTIPEESGKNQVFRGFEGFDSRSKKEYNAH